MRIITFTLLIHLLFLECIASELKIVGVGQASFSMVTSGDRGMVFDCGVQTKRTWIDQGKNIILSPKDTLIKSCLKGVKNLTIVISHNHDDHHNLLVPLCKLATELKLQVTIIKSWEKTRAEIEASINGALGSGVAIRPLFPEYREGPVHDYCLVLKLSVNGKNILLTGDASGRLIEQISKDVMDTDVLLFSHHGSDESRELLLIDKISGRNLSTQPLLGIVSSDVFGASRIPRYYPGYKGHTNPENTFLERMSKTAIPLSGMNGKFFCRYHNLTFYDQLIDSEYTAPAIVPEPLSVIPVFSTGDLGQGLFYRVCVDAVGSISMYRHGDAIPLYRVGGPEFVFPETFLYSEILSGIARLTKIAFEKRLESYRSISHVFPHLPHDRLSSGKENLVHEAEALLTLKNSRYIPDTVKLKRSLHSMNLIFSYSKLLEDKLLLLALSSEPFSSEWASFLWKNDFLKTDEKPINSLANLLSSYFINHVTPNLKNDVQICQNGQPLTLTPQAILGMLNRYCRLVRIEKDVLNHTLPIFGWSLNWKETGVSLQFLDWIHYEAEKLQEPLDMRN